MELLFKNNIIGYINYLYKENYWIYGTFRANGKFEKFKEFFEALINEDGFDENKFEHELLDEKNWMIKKDGRLIDIDIPAIYDDGEIVFRYR